MKADATSLRVRAILIIEAAVAYGFRSRAHREGEILSELCGHCGHHFGAHHGKLGEGACAETGCGCEAYEIGPDLCLWCLRPWPLPALECEHCGMTLEQAAEEIRRRAKEDR